METEKIRKLAEGYRQYFFTEATLVLEGRIWERAGQKAICARWV